MNRRRPHRLGEHLRHEAQAEEGIGMILVLGMGLVVTILISVAFGISEGSIRSSRTHSRFDAALTSAESGIDTALARAQSTYLASGSDSYLYPTVGNAECSAVAPTVSLTNERITASQAANAIAALGGGCLHHVRSGDYVFFKVAGIATVYAKGWSPSFSAAAAQGRLVKAEYLFTPYRPVNAILTGGNLEIDSSSTVTTVAGSSPALAMVHANGAITVPNGNPTVSGLVTSTASSGSASSNNFLANVAGGTVPQTPVQDIPTTRALDVFYANWSTTSFGWYDLCADGVVRLPSAAGPCAPGNTVVPYTGTFNNGWTYTAGSPPTWNVTGAFNPGTYYIDGGNVAMGAGLGNPAVGNATIIAAASGPGCGVGLGGNITWDHVNIAAPTVSNLFMFADHNLSTQSNFSAGSSTGGTVISGLFIAGDQVNLQTSSAGAYGAVIAQDNCPPAAGTINVVKNPSLYFDPTLKAPFTSIINTTLWLEYPNT
jgi:hypothetical protein